MRFLLLGLAALGLGACTRDGGSAQIPQQSTVPAATPVLTCPPAPAACRDFRRDQLNDPRDPDYKLWIEERAPRNRPIGA